MRKKYIIIIGLILLLISGGYLIFEEITYSPLTEKDFKNLFPNYDGSAKKKCSVDFIGLNLHGDLFDISVYELNSMVVDTRYPNIKNSWNDITLPDEMRISSWQKIPIDSLTYLKCKDVLNMGNYQKHQCCDSFVLELSNPTNYYSYLYINELEYYFYLYCPNKHRLYYVRKKGW